ncbi:MAG TPA: AAA family ATPase, partial [Gemmatimonadaceae bacterium]|nr:AAA family ATPase [Gemmatimonadaceae bacterium]
MIRLAAIADCTIQLDKARLDGSSEILFGILAHLIVERGKPVSRGWLVDAFWWNADEADGRHCLRQSIYKLRQLGVSIDSGIDTFTLGERAARADFDCPDERTLALSPLPPEEAVAIFPGYAPRASAPFLTWLERTREKAGRAVRGVLVRALGEARRRNGWEEAAKLARQCLVLDPLNEEATLTLAEYTALQGDKREALRLIDSYMEEIGGTYGDLRIPASLLRNRISERVAYPPASAAGKIAIVGRDDSLRVLAGVSAEVSAGAGQTCVIHGPPGIGKTRLLTEYANISAMKGARIVRVDCHADAAERALSVFMELAPQLLRMPGALGCSPEALRLVRRLGRHDPTERLDPDEYGGPAFLHAAVRASLRDLIDAIAAERPLYLLIEDVHWIDPVSLEVLKEIIGSNRGRQLLVLMTTRTLGDGTLLDGVDRRQLIVHELAPLGDVASRRLAETLCGALAIEADGQLVDWCMQRAAGNPLFMTELLAHWRETKDTERVPVSLEALIDERVGALSEAGLRTLQAIALLEGEATYEMLEAVLGMQRWQVMGCVEELDKGGIVAAERERLRVRHELLAAAARARLTAVNKSLLHSRAAAAFEALRGDRNEATAVWLAAEHYIRAGQIPRGVRLSVGGVSHLAGIGAHSLAANLLDRVLRYVSDTDARLELLDLRRQMLEAAMRYRDIIRNTEEAWSLTSSSARGQRRHDAHELALYMAYHQAGTLADNRPGAMAEILACARDVNAAPDHRLSACVWGLATAAAEGSRKAAEAFLCAVQAIVATTPAEQFSLAKCQLIYDTVFGSLDSAAAT